MSSCSDISFFIFFFFFFNDTATTEIYTLSLHDALPIYERITEELFLGQYPELKGKIRVQNRNVQRGEMIDHVNLGLPVLYRSEEHTSELQSHSDLVCRLLLEKKKKKKRIQ